MNYSNIAGRRRNFAYCAKGDAPLAPPTKLRPERERSKAAERRKDYRLFYEILA